MNRVYITLIISTILVGCASTRQLGELPATESEFNLSLDELKEKYPDITEYNKGFGHCTSVDEFVSKLGEPSTIDTEDLQMPFLSVPIGISAGGVGGAAVVVIAYGMYPKQPRKYYWVKGKYLVSARVLTDISCRYNNRVHMFEWNEAS